MSTYTVLNSEEKPSLLANLSFPERAAFQTLKSLCEEKNVYWPTSAVDGGKDSNDNTDLLRFLRARSFDCQAAFKQYEATASWRRKVQIDQMYDNSDMDDFETVRKLVRDGRPWPVSLLTRAFRQLPQWTGRRNLNGIPICVYVVSEIPIKSVLSVQQRDPNLSSVFLPAEYMTQFVQPLCGQMTPDGVQVTRSVNIVDLSGVGVGMFWNLRKLLQTSSSMATAHYPESVERIFVIGAPSFFPTIWGFIQRWFEPATTSKIAVLSDAEVTSTLAQHIDLADVPRRYGGTLEWEFGDHPLLDKETEDMLSTAISKNINGPVRLVGENQKVVAVGSDGGRRRRDVLGKLKTDG